MNALLFNAPSQETMMPTPCHHSLHSTGLEFDFSHVLKRSSRLLLTPWSEGVRWTLCLEDEIETGLYYDEAPLPLAFLKANPSHQTWLNTIPKILFNRLSRYADCEFALLYLCSHYPCVADLFISHPTLVWLMIKTAREQQWSESRFVALSQKKRIDIVAACGLPRQPQVIKLLQKFKSPQFGWAELNQIRTVFNLDYTRFNHLSMLDQRLVLLAQKHPNLMGSQFMLHYDPNTWAYRSLSLIEDCYNLARVLNIADLNARLPQCRSFEQLQELHDRLLRQRTPEAPIDENAPYPPPPYAGNEDIVPITTFADLKEEGKQQKNCVIGYHQRICQGQYVIYRVHRPQRATLGLKLQTGLTPQIDQLKGISNCEVTKETLKAVCAWISRQAPLNPI